MAHGQKERLCICRIYTAILNPQLLHNTCRMVLQIQTFPGFFFLSDSLNEHHKLQDILLEILLIDYGIFTGFQSRCLPSSTVIMGKLQELCKLVITGKLQEFVTGCSFMFNVLNNLRVSNRIMDSWKF